MLYLAVAIDVLHAMLMVAWVLGIPLLFWHRYKKLSMAYAIFSLAFVIVNQVSHYTLGVCIFTTIADFFYRQAGQVAPEEWFTVRLSKWIFGLTPTQRSVKMATEFLICLSALGGMYFLFRKKN